MKSEKEKMLAGELYFSGDQSLVDDRLMARMLTSEYNGTRAIEEEEREEILKRLIVVKGDAKIQPPFHCDYGYNIEVGENFYANFSCTILDVNRVIIGDNVMFGPNVQVYTATHPLDPKERIKGLESSKPITIGDNVWIGGGAIILPGVTIGKNTTIGAGSVVTKDIPKNVLAGGNPCKIIKEL
ncbi:MAG: sugar O-acetyltransferase [Psychrilyobacter sp.]|uniref:sugar O-acetyltransferase n=1 Tax=Psychrilyobacter sp. TaxID=2586924 RepID=UPI003C7407EF